MYQILAERREKLHEVASRRHQAVLEELVRAREADKSHVWTWWTVSRSVDGASRAWTMAHFSFHRRNVTVCTGVSLPRPGAREGGWLARRPSWRRSGFVSRLALRGTVTHDIVAKYVPQAGSSKLSKPFDWSGGATPSRLGPDEAASDLAIMEVSYSGFGSSPYERHCRIAVQWLSSLLSRPACTTLPPFLFRRTISTLHSPYLRPWRPLPAPIPSLPSAHRHR